MLNFDKLCKYWTSKTNKGVLNVAKKQVFVRKFCVDTPPKLWDDICKQTKSILRKLMNIVDYNSLN